MKTFALVVQLVFSLALLGVSVWLGSVAYHTPPGPDAGLSVLGCFAAGLFGFIGTVVTLDEMKRA